MQIVINGVAREATPEEMAAHQAQQAADQPTLEEAKAAKRKEINTRRDALMYGSHTFEGVPYDVDAKAREKLTGMHTLLVDGLALPEGFTWTAADDSEVDHDATSLKALCLSIMTWTNGLHVAARQHKAAVAALTTMDAVEGYDVDGGW